MRNTPDIWPPITSYDEQAIAIIPKSRAQPKIIVVLGLSPSVPNSAAGTIASVTRQLNQIEHSRSCNC
jgi:hypothetical protein